MFWSQNYLKTVNKGKIAWAEMLKNNNSIDVLELKNPENNNNNISQKQENTENGNMLPLLPWLPLLPLLPLLTFSVLTEA